MGASLILFLSSMFLSHSLFADVTVPSTVPKDVRVSPALTTRTGGWFVEDSPASRTTPATPPRLGTWRGKGQPL